MVLRRNILVFHSGALGDFILTWPLALTLARLFPQSRLFYVTQGQKGALAERVLRVESADAGSGGWHALFSDAAQLPAPAAKLLAGAHTVVSFLSGEGDPLTLRLRSAAPEAKLVALSPNAPDSHTGHLTEYYLDQLHATWPAAEAAGRQILKSIASRGLVPAGSAATAGDGAPPSPSGPVVIHPGAGSPHKCWPAERFLELIALLRGGGRAVQVLLGEVERERWGGEVIARFAKAADVQEPGSYVDLLARLSGASAFVGNDSGPGHLAGVLGVPTVSIFGPSNPARWRPLGPRVAVVRGEPLESLSAEQVRATMGRSSGAE